MTTEKLKTAGVEVTALGDFATVISGYAFKSSEFLKQGIPVIKIANIGVGLVDIADAQCVSTDYLNLLRPKYQVHPRDILISLTGSQITQPNSVVGRVARQSSNAPLAFLNQRAGKVIVDDPDRCNADYLYWALLNRDTRHQIAAMAHGAASQANVSPSQVESLKIRLPPFHVQRQIASILSAYDDLIENSTRRIAILEEMARRLYEEWFVRFRFPGHEGVPMVESELGSVPEGWVAATIGEAASYVNRGLSPKYDDAAVCLVINQKCIRDQRLTLGAARRQSKPVPAGKLLQFGDVLINSTGVGTLGRVAQVLENLANCTADSHVSIVRAGDSCDLDYFGLSLFAQQAHFEAQGVGSTGQTELSRTRISETSIMLPPLDIQQQFGKLVRPMRNLAIILQNKNTNLRTTRDLLLPKLISGELDVSTLPERQAQTA